MFKKYPSINNQNNEKAINYLKSYLIKEDKTDMNFIATEKIHGSNFSIIVNDSELISCRRNDILKKDEPFYNYLEIVELRKNDIFTLKNNIERYIQDVNYFQIIGELFGGYYKNMKNNLKSIQNEVCYTNNYEFLVFDILINGQYFLSYSEIIKLMNGLHHLKYIPILKEGKLEDLLNLSPVFDSTIPSLYNMPQISPNLAEGFVLKIDERSEYSKYRPIIKIKNFNVFNEVREQVHLSLKNEKKEENEKIENEIRSYLTENRFINVKSKELENISKNKLNFLFVSDALEDYKKANTSNLSIIEKYESIIKGKLIFELNSKN